MVIRGRNKPYTDKYQGIPFGYTNARGVYIRLSTAERELVSLGKMKLPKEKRAKKEVVSSQRGEVAIETTKRGGKWVQVGSDNLTAFIVNR
jgi:hypothetical protein